MTDAPELAPYRGEFRYIFFAPSRLYEETVAFYRDVLGFPVVGGFSYGTYIKASTGVIEIISDPGEGDELRDQVHGADEYRPPQGAWLLIEVLDLDTVYRSAVEAKAEVLYEPRDWERLFRDFKLKDPCGNIVCLFRRLPGWEQFH